MLLAPLLSMLTGRTELTLVVVDDALHLKDLLQILHLNVLDLSRPVA